jgi:predicted flavoprotein YhiN
LPGTSFENAEIRIPGLKTEESGPLLITHWGLSDRLFLKISAWEARTLAKLNISLKSRLNFFPRPISDAEEELKNSKIKILKNQSVSRKYLM